MNIINTANENRDFNLTSQLNNSINNTNITILNESFHLNNNFSPTSFEKNMNGTTIFLNFIMNFGHKIWILILNFVNQHTILSGAIIGILIGLLVGSPWIRFKAEKFVRDLFKRPILSIELISRIVNCKDGFVLFHGLSLKNKMWFTNKIPLVVCTAPTTLNRGTLCEHIGTMWDDNLEIITISEFRKEYYKCIITQTQDDSKRKMDIYRGVGKTVYVIMEEIHIEDQSIPLNESNKIGKFYLNSRNLMPDLKIGWNQTLNVVSDDFGLIDTIKIKIPDNLGGKEPLDRSLLGKRDRDKCLLDVGIPTLRWPLRIEQNRKIS
jgi:hypothetical protein